MKSINTNSSKQPNKEESIVKSEESNNNPSKPSEDKEKEKKDLNNLSLPQIARLPSEQQERGSSTEG